MRVPKESSFCILIFDESFGRKRKLTQSGIHGESIRQNAWLDAKKRKMKKEKKIWDTD